MRRAVELNRKRYAETGGNRGGYPVAPQRVKLQRFAINLQRTLPPMLLVENIKKAYREPNGDRLPILNGPRLELGSGEQVVIRGAHDQSSRSEAIEQARTAGLDEGLLAAAGAQRDGVPGGVGTA